MANSVARGNYRAAQAKEVKPIQVEGLSEFIRSAKKVSDQFPQELKAINKELAQPLVEEAKKRAPVRSGKLRDSIRPGATQKVAYVMAGKKAVPYAGPIHWGWPKERLKSSARSRGVLRSDAKEKHLEKTNRRGGAIPANPFLVEALAAKKDELNREAEKRLQQFVDRVWESIPQ